MKSGRVPLHGKFWSEGQRGGGGPWSEALIKAPLTWDPLWNRSLYRWLKTNGLRWVHFSIPLLFIEDLEGTVGLPSAWKSFRSQTQLTDCFFFYNGYTLNPSFDCKDGKLSDLFVCLWRPLHSCGNSTSSPGINLLPGVDKSGYCWWEKIRKSPVEVGSLSHYLQGFLHPRWSFGISSTADEGSTAKNLCELWLR